MLRAGGEVLLLRYDRGAGLRMPVAAEVSGAASAHADTEATWREFRRSLRAFVARRVPSPADVDDIVQDVFLRMHRSQDAIRSRDRVHAWLYTTARRAVTDHSRGGARRREVLAGDAQDLEVLHAGPELGPEDDEARAEVAACLAPVLGRLPQIDREAISRIDVEGRRVAEVAERFGLSVPGMKSRVQRARRRLRQAMLACCRLALDGQGVPIACGVRSRDACGARTDLQEA